jgi:uncharacterized protein
METFTLITGASSGIGWELAKLFARDGHHLVLVARNQHKLEELAQELQARHGIKTKVLVKDLADPAAPVEIVAELQHEAIQIDVLVNNAGTQVYGTFVDVKLQDLLDMIQINLTALTHLTKLLLPGMVERKRGKILNLGSTGSFVPGPLNAVYCATKAYLLSLSEALAAELAGTGVTVTTLCPGATDTAFAPRHGMQKVRFFRKMMGAAQVAQIGYRALMQQRHLVVAGYGNSLQVLLYQVLAPFLPLIPASIMKRVGAYVMGQG